MISTSLLSSFLVLSSTSSAPLQTAELEFPFSSSAPLASQDLDALLVAFKIDSGLYFLDDLVTVFNYSGSLGLLWRQDGLIDTDALPCRSSKPDDLAMCFIVKYSQILGVEHPESELVLRKISDRSNVSGLIVVSFDHVINGINVWSTGVNVGIDVNTNRIQSVSSSFVANHIVSSASFLDVSDPGSLIDAITLSSGSDVRDVKSIVRIYYIDKPNHSLIAIPAYRIHFVTSDGMSFDAILDGSDLSVLRLSPLDAFLSSLEIESNTFAKEHSAYSCGGLVICPPGMGYTCRAGNCIKFCNPAPIPPRNDCLSYGYWWTCLDGDYQFDGFCSYVPFMYEGHLYSELRPVFSTAGGWELSDYESFYMFNEVKTVLDDLNDWIWNIVGWSSWNNDPEDPKTLLVRYRIDHAYQNTVSAGASFNSDDECMYIYHYSDSPSTTDSTWADMYNLFAHEFGHGMIGSANLPMENEDECISEIYASMYGALFAPNYFIGNWGDYGQSAFLDEVWGLNYGVAYTPYARRSVFDNYKCKYEPEMNDFTGVVCSSENQCGLANGCGPYECCLAKPDSSLECNTMSDYNNNTGIWRRFIRIWAEGSSTFSENGNDESMGISFAGAGLAAANSIFADVIELAYLDEGYSLQDLAFQLISRSGTQAAATRYALGAIGVRTGAYVVASGYNTDKSISGVRFDAWSMSSTNDKYFYAWKSYGGTNIRVRYHYGTQYMTANWSSANAGSSPIMVEYNDTLHVFWRNASTGAITYRTITSTGSTSDYISLITKDILADGDFDVAVHGESLYVVYKRPGDNHVYLSRCDYAYAGCLLMTWDQFSGNYRYQLPIYTREGPGVVAATDLNGLYEWASDDEFLYIAHADPITFEIKISRVEFEDSSGIVWGTVQIHDTSPSHQATGRIGITVRKSAYPEGDNYLYLAWKDADTNQLYFSVLQSWDGYGGLPDGTNYWITRPHYLDLESPSGPSFVKHENEEYVTSTEILYRDGTSPMRTAWVGRY